MERLDLLVTRVKLLILPEIIRCKTFSLFKWSWIVPLTGCDIFRGGASYHGESAVVLWVDLYLFLCLIVAIYWFVVVRCALFLFCARFGIYGFLALLIVFGFGSGSGGGEIVWFLGSFGVDLVTIGGNELEDGHYAVFVVDFLVGLLVMDWLVVLLIRWSELFHENSCLLLVNLWFLLLLIKS